MVDLIQELQRFDGKQTAPLEDVAARLLSDEHAVELLLAACESEEPKLETAASWVLKRLQEQGRTLSSPQSNRLLKLLPTLQAWEAKLHVLQMLPQVRVTKRLASTVFQAAVDFLDSEDNKFLRAWSYNALVVLADAHPQLRGQAGELVALAQQEEAASVRARIRNATKSVDWLE